MPTSARGTASIVDASCLRAVLTGRAVLEGSGAQALTLAPFGAGQDVDVAGLAAGAAILALSFLGFDAVSTEAQEAERPRRDLPRTIFIIVAVASVFFVGLTYAMQSLFRTFRG